MNSDAQIAITFGLLAMSILAVWLPPIPTGKHPHVHAWLLLFVASVISGVVSGFLGWSAVLSLVLFGSVAYFAGQAGASRRQRTIFGILTAVTALALAMHRLPGFNNPVLIANAKFTADAAPFTQYANFDKAAAGLILLAWLCRRTATARDWKTLSRRTPLIALVTTALVLTIAVAFGYVHLDLKVPAYTPVFLAVNLLFTCVAEEAFFRGFLQERLTVSLKGFRVGGLIVIGSSGLLFGIVHVGGGISYVLLATLAGFGYACAYASVRRVEAAILTHFIVNAVHFIGFTYPQIG